LIIKKLNLKQTLIEPIIHLKEIPHKEILKEIIKIQKEVKIYKNKIRSLKFKIILMKETIINKKKNLI
jgi:hypothetical protein